MHYQRVSFLVGSCSGVYFFLGVGLRCVFEDVSLEILFFYEMFWNQGTMYTHNIFFLRFRLVFLGS